MPDWVSNKMRRIEKIREAKKALEEEARARALADSRAKGATRQEAKAAAKNASPEPRAQRNFTDSQSRIMKGADGFVQEPVEKPVGRALVARRCWVSAGDKPPPYPFSTGC